MSVNSSKARRRKRAAKVIKDIRKKWTLVPDGVTDNTAIYQRRIDNAGTEALHDLEALLFALELERG